MHMHINATSLIPTVLLSIHINTCLIIQHFLLCLFAMLYFQPLQLEDRWLENKSDFMKQCPVHRLFNLQLDIFHDCYTLLHSVNSVTTCYKLTVIQKCRLCTILTQPKVTTRWQGCLGNYSCVLTESDIQHCVRKI